jgi:hypothetical protein
MLTPHPRWPVLTLIPHAGYRFYVRKLVLDTRSKAAELCTCVVRYYVTTVVRNCHGTNVTFRSNISSVLGLNI